MNHKQKQPRRLLQAVVAVFLIGSTVILALNRDRLSTEKFRAMGYAGVFLLAWLGSSAVLLPIPHTAFTLTMGAVLNPWLVGLAAGIGDALGELPAYIVGYAVEGDVKNLALHQRLNAWMSRSGDLTIFVFSLLPVPFIDMPALASGLVAYPLWRFMLSTWVGKTIKAILAAWAGYYGIGWIAKAIGE